MCGIAGVVSSKISSRASDLMKMAEFLLHRGPDRLDTTVFESTGFAHTRLEIVGSRESGMQPAWSPDKRWLLAYNGEIHNDCSLRDSLPLYPYQGESDTEILLNGLMHKGLDFIRLIDGFFAFAALDTLHNKLFLCRDRSGVKPLYYSDINSEFHFASEIGALLEVLPSSTLNEPVFRGCLYPGKVNGPSTCINNIFRLTPGNILTLDLRTSTFQLEEWHSPSQYVSVDKYEYIKSEGRDKAIERIDNILCDSVNSRVPLGLKKGAYLSGGLDSSLIASIAKVTGHNLLCFGASLPDDKQYCEYEYAKDMADALKLDLIEVPITKASFQRAFVSSTCHFEYPLWFEGSIGRALVSEVANSMGFKVLLSGEGSDELFGGYHWKYMKLRKLFAIEKGLNEVSLNSTINSYEDNGFDDLIGVQKTYDCAHLKYKSTLIKKMLMKYHYFGKIERHLSTYLGYDLMDHLVATLCISDKNGMQHSIEDRYPFLDHKLVSEAMNMPLEWRMVPKPKGILMEVAEKYIPKRLINRPKVGFNFDPDPYIKNRINKKFLLDSYLAELYEIPTMKMSAALESHSGRTLFRLCSAEIWLRRFIERDSEGAIEAKLWANAS